MVSVKYTGAFRDYSGYGEANRQFINALHSAGVNTQAELVKYCPDKGLDFGPILSVCEQCGQNQIGGYKVKVLHITPDQLTHYVENGKYNISHLFWETDLLPTRFVDGLRYANEVWTGSQANADAIRNSTGINNIFIFPQPYSYIEPNMQSLEFKDALVKDKINYVFYSIFEWSDRKNPVGLIISFLKEFDGVSDVELVLKTYKTDYSLDFIFFAQNVVNQLIVNNNISNAPLISFIFELVDKSNIIGLHLYGDCYVSPHHGEGWGIPTVEAMSYGNPVITTGYGGIGEYLTNDIHGIVLDYEMDNIEGMVGAEHYYERGQKWAVVSEDDIRGSMKKMYLNKEKTVQMGAEAKKFVETFLSPVRIGNLMKERIIEIEGSVGENSLY